MVNTRAAASLAWVAEKYPDQVLSSSRRRPARLLISRPKNAAVRTREYLTKDEVEALIKAVVANRNGPCGLFRGAHFHKSFER